MNNKKLLTVAGWLGKLRRYIPFLILAAILFGRVTASADLYDAAMATVRIRCENGVGSGIVVGANDLAYFALTNAHVANRQLCTVEFFSGGKISAQVQKCATVSRDPGNDVAVVQIPKSMLRGHVPTIMPIDPALDMKPGDPICSVGHPHGENPTAFVGGYVGKTADGSIKFRPPPAQGRSGSALFDKDFTRVVGLIWGCDTEKVQDRLGYGVPAARFATALGKELAKISIAQDPIEIDHSKQVAFYDNSAASPEISILNRKPGERIRNPNRTPIRERLKDRRGERRNDRQTPNAASDDPTTDPVPEPTIPDNLQTSEKTAITIEIGDVSLGIKKPVPEPPKPAQPAQPAPPPPHWTPRPYFPPKYPFPPPVPRPFGPPFPPPFGVTDGKANVELCQFSPYGYCPSGTCPNGSCPTESVPAIGKPGAIKPLKPIPTGPKEETTLPEPDPETVRESIPRLLKSDEIPVDIAPPDPRLEKIPEIEKTVLGLRDGQSGIDKKVDQALEKVGELIDAKKDAVKIDLESFREETLEELDSRVGALEKGIDARLVVVQTELQKLETTNQRIGELKESIENFSLLPEATAVYNWLRAWGWLLVILAAVVVFGALQARQIYYTKGK